MKRTLLLLTLATATVAANAQWNDPSLSNDIRRARFTTLYGPSGLIKVPNAYVSVKNRVVVGTFFGENKSVAANYGLLGSVEIGGAYIDRHLADGKAIANAKLNVIPSNLKGIELGLGVIDAVDAINRTFYIMGSGEILPPDFLERQGAVGLRLHAGYGSKLFREKLIGGAEVLFGNKVSAIGEYDGKNMNTAVRYIPNESVRLQVGVADKKLFFGTAFAFNP